LVYRQCLDEWKELVCLLVMAQMSVPTRLDESGSRYSTMLMKFQKDEYQDAPVQHLKLE
jgi:hypothetical protein